MVERKGMEWKGSKEIKLKRIRIASGRELK